MNALHWIILALAPELAMFALFALAGLHHVPRRHRDRAVQTAGILAKDSRLPRAARLGFVIAVLPIPGPVDEIVGVLCAGVLVAHPTYRLCVREAWCAA